MNRKSQFLGMPHGTASSRLRKLILFDLLRRHKENICFKCTQLIEKVEELSIEHKKPWEGVSVELFWNLENIAFSHLICNTKGRREKCFRGHLLNPENTEVYEGQRRCKICRKVRVNKLQSTVEWKERRKVWRSRIV